MRHVRLATWAWRALLALYWLGVLLGFAPTGPSMSWLVNFEVWLTNRVPDPILFALVTGLIISTWIIPEIWGVVKPHFVSTKKAYAALVTLRTEGVGLRNQGRSAAYSDDQWLEWEARLVQWRQRVSDIIATVSTADAEMWFTLNVIPDADLPMDSIFAEDHERHQYTMHNFRVTKLEAVIDHYGKK